MLVCNHYAKTKLKMYGHSAGGGWGERGKEAAFGQGVHEVDPMLLMANLQIMIGI